MGLGKPGRADALPARLSMLRRRIAQVGYGIGPRRVPVVAPGRVRADCRRARRCRARSECRAWVSVRGQQVPGGSGDSRWCGLASAGLGFAHVGRDVLARWIGSSSAGTIRGSRGGGSGRRTQALSRRCHGSYSGRQAPVMRRSLASRRFGRARARRRRGRHGSGEARRAGPTRREVMASAGASALALTAGAGLAQPAGGRERVRVRGPRSHRKARARQSRHRRGDGVERPRRGAHRRGGALAAAGGRRRQRVRDQAAALEHAAGPRRGCRASRGCISPGAARPTSPTATPAWPATGALPASIDFPLTRQEESASLRGPAVRRHAARRTARSSATCATTSSPARSARKAAFGINHGDIVFDDLSLYPRYLQILGATGHPLAPLPRQPRHQLGSPRRPAVRARPGSACSGRATTPSSMRAPRSSCSITCTISATTPVRRAAAPMRG